MAGAPAQRDDEPITAINITPLVDVSLVLVIIFMAIAPYAIQAGLKVLESRATTAVGKVSASENVSIKLAKDGRLTINGKAGDLETLLVRIQAALMLSKDKMVTITADPENRVGQVVEILDAARQAGAEKLAIMREGPAKAPPAQGKS
jgi:biopolymer transport protein ExbD